MKIKIITLTLGIILISFSITACTSTETQVSEPAATGNPAMVDGVSVDFRNGHYYALVIGFYPDACTRISSVEQTISESKISIALSTDRPEDLMCAQMLTQFEVDIMIATGGLTPGEYTVDVNGVTTTFTLGE